MDFLNIVNAILYYPILIIILIASGLYFTFKTGVIQISLFKNAFSVITETPKKRRSLIISSSNGFNSLKSWYR